jgi:hypothetical protein
MNDARATMAVVIPGAHRVMAAAKTENRRRVFELQVAAQMLGGEVHHDQIICPGPGHSAPGLRRQVRKPAPLPALRSCVGGGQPPA